MIKPNDWMPVFSECLRRVFGERFLYLGLQGSYRRGEATESSDIDSVCVIDRFALADLDAYRGAVRAMPEGEKACGFLGGREELLAWPRHELFSLKMDTMDYYGKLDDFLPPIGREDIVMAVRTGAAGLYHPLVHTYLYGDAAAREECLRAARKGAFFVLLCALYLRDGVFYPTRKELPETVPEGYGELIDWTRELLVRKF